MDYWGPKLSNWENDDFAFKPKSLLSSEEVAKYEVTLAELEGPDLPVEVISNPKVLEFVRYLASPAEVHPNEFPLRARGLALVKKWRRLEAAAASAALSDLFPSSDSPAIPIPRDVLMYILKSYVGDASITDDRKEWRRKLDYLLDCTLVAKDWNVVTNYLLYRGPIVLESAESTKLLLQTVENWLETPCPIQQLKFDQRGPSSSRTEFAQHAVSLICRCRSIRFLDVQSIGLSFYLEASMPIFDKLRELKLAYETLNLVAPLLHKLPNLQILRFFCVEIQRSRLRVEFAGSPLSGNFVEDIPPPTFMLKELQICQCAFSLEQCQWLLSSSTAIDYVELQEVYDAAAVGMASVIGPHVKALHIKGEVYAPQEGNDDLSAEISKFTALTSLRVSGRDWPWDTLLADIRPSLEAFAISYSKPGCENVLRFLSDTSWQPYLQTLTIYHWANTDYFYGITPDNVRDAKSLLEGACEMRKVSLNWITDIDVNEPFDDITEEDLD